MYNYFQMNTQNNYYQRNKTENFDFGPTPFIIDIYKATLNNNNFRTALWTGNNMQLTLMNIPAGEDIGLEMHSDVDQFIKIENGTGLVKMGNEKEKLLNQQIIFTDTALFIPKGTWHNIINIGNEPLKLYSIYAPVQHPWGTVHLTKEIAESMENH
ncbi:cupin domain-containing protein [Thomasclavelia sp.]